MTLLKLSLEHMNKNDVNSVLKPFKNLMLKALDFRNLNHNTISLEDIEKFENSCNEAFSVFIPKMSEITFRPLFYKVCVLYSNETTFICFNYKNDLKIRSVCDLYSHFECETEISCLIRKSFNY
jgi:hypothetical protein